MPSLEQGINMLASAIQEKWDMTGGDKPFREAAFSPNLLHREHGGPSSQMVGKICRRFKGALNQALHNQGGFNKGRLFLCSYYPGKITIRHRRPTDDDK